MHPAVQAIALCQADCRAARHVRQEAVLRPASLNLSYAGNDFSTLYAPLIRNGRMEQFYWKPNRQDLLAILLQMYKAGTQLMHNVLMQ